MPFALIESGTALAELMTGGVRSVAFKIMVVVL